MSKRALYIALFVLLGVIVSFLVHAAIEIPLINLLVEDFDTYGLGLTWGNWFFIHHIGAVALLLAGAALGYQQGRYWWGVVYGSR